MKIQVIGIQEVEYTNKSGNLVHGCNMFAVGVGSDNIVGHTWLGQYNSTTHSYKPLWVGANKINPKGLKPGYYEVEYNQYGGIENIAFISEK